MPDESIEAQQKCSMMEIQPVIEERVVLHRLPYMKMNQKIIDNVNIFLFILTCALAFNDEVLHLANNSIACFLSSFNIFIYPGFFYFFAN
jgi:hypothetical protein